MLYHRAYSTGQVPSHTFLLIGRFLQFCIRLAPEMKQYVTYVRTAGGPSVTSLVTLVQHLSRYPSATVLLKLTLSSDSHRLVECMKLQHFKLYKFKSI